MDEVLVSKCSSVPELWVLLFAEIISVYLFLVCLFLFKVIILDNCFLSKELLRKGKLSEVVCQHAAYMTSL